MALSIGTCSARTRTPLFRQPDQPPARRDLVRDLAYDPDLREGAKWNLRPFLLRPPGDRPGFLHAAGKRQSGGLVKEEIRMPRSGAREARRGCVATPLMQRDKPKGEMRFKRQGIERAQPQCAVGVGGRRGRVARKSVDMRAEIMRR